MIHVIVIGLIVFIFSLWICKIFGISVIPKKFRLKPKNKFKMPNIYRDVDGTWHSEKPMKN